MIMDNAIRPSMKRTYKSKLKMWLAYCKAKDLDPWGQDTYTVLNFLAREYQRKLRWATIRAYVPALGDYLQHVDMFQIKRFIRGVFNLRPPKAKYTAMWDVDTVLTYISAMVQVSHKDITMKLATLFMLLSGNRVNMLSNMKLTGMFLTNLEVTFVFDDVLKNSRPGFNTSPMIFRAFPFFSSLCPVRVLRSYLDVRNPLADTSALFITTIKSNGIYRAAKPDTIARWIKDTLVLSGVDSGRYSAHSCRSASTSAAFFRGISLSTIVRSASWSNVTTFKKHYLREIKELYDLDEENFGESMLHNYVDANVV